MIVEVEGLVDDEGPYFDRIPEGHPCTVCGEFASKRRWCQEKSGERRRWVGEECIDESRKGRIE